MNPKWVKWRAVLEQVEVTEVGIRSASCELELEQVMAVLASRYEGRCIGPSLVAAAAQTETGQAYTAFTTRL